MSAFEKWFSEAGFRSEIHSSAVLNDCWNAAITEALAALPKKKEMCSCRFGECRCGRFEHNACLEEVREALEKLKEQK